MAQNINQKLIAVIGPRKSGRSTVLEKIQYFKPEYQRFHMWSFALQEFTNLHNITITEFFLRPGELIDAGANPEINKLLFSLYCDYRRSTDMNFSITPALEYIKNKNRIIIDDIYYYNELATLVDLGATIIYVDTDRDIRVKRGLTKKMEEIDMYQYVSAISAHQVKNWKRTYIMNNDKELNTLHIKVQALIEDLNL
jgi:hypothetical protein